MILEIKGARKDVVYGKPPRLQLIADVDGLKEPIMFSLPVGKPADYEELARRIKAGERVTVDVTAVVTFSAPEEAKL